ncbi:hypothetical protein, partial [Paraburkholderia sp. SIMBA_053]|uniref:hypothetical protein n=1 Tax=Paraburkholderia sp. SIMBA_053 TaxID=3085794 RepID=UPI00397C2CC8
LGFSACIRDLGMQVHTVADRMRSTGVEWLAKSRMAERIAAILPPFVTQPAEWTASTRQVGSGHHPAPDDLDRGAQPSGHRRVVHPVAA